MNSQDAIELVEAVQHGEFEDARLEVKRAQKGLPTHLKLFLLLPTRLMVDSLFWE